MFTFHPGGAVINIARLRQAAAKSGNLYTDGIMQFLFFFFFVYILFAILGYYYKTGDKKSLWLYANKAVNTWFTAISTAATSIGGSATIVLGYMIYSHGWSGIFIDLPVGIGILFLGVFLAPRLRAENVNTVPELIGKYYGDSVRKITAVFIILTEMAWFGLLIKSFVVFIPVDTLISGNLLIIIAGILFLFYIYWSGQRGVYITDFIQSLIIIGGIMLLFFWTLFEPAQNPNILVVREPLSAAAQGGFFVMMFLSGISGPDILSRVFYARTEKDAKSGIILGGIIKIVITLIIALIAYKALAILPNLNNGYQLFPELIRHFFAFPFDSILLVVFLLILVTSADTVTMTAITTLNNDLLRKGLKLQIIRYQVWILGLTGIAFALYFSTILDILKIAYTFYAAGPALFVLYSFFRVKINPFRAFEIITIAGVSAIILQLFFSQVVNPILISAGINVALTFILRNK